MRKPKVEREKLGETARRATLIFIAVLFLGTALIGGLYFIFSPADTSNQEQAQMNDQLQGKPLTGFEPVQKVNELQKIDQKAGTGTEVKADSTVTVIYTGAVASTGTVFQSSADTGQPFETKLNAVIKGWQEGMLGMKAGGQRRLLIPAALAYGAASPPGSGIPPNADLVFDITLLAVE